MSIGNTKLSIIKLIRKQIIRKGSQIGKILRNWQKDDVRVLEHYGETQDWL